VPDWAHLVLDRVELSGYLSLVLEKTRAARVTAYVAEAPYINRRFEGDFRREIEASDFENTSIQAWGGHSWPSPELRDELERRWPTGGDFAVHGLRVVLRRSDPDPA
jgi:hypothetical protein